MSLGEVSIADLPDSLNHLSEFEPWNIEDNDLTDLFRSISDKIPIDYEGSEIRLIGKKIFIRNRTRESWLGNITMIPSSNLPEPEIWPVEDLFVITIDQHFLEEDGCPEEKLRERWKKEMKDNLRKFAGFDTQPFEFEIHNRNEYPVEDEFLEHRQPRIRIDMQYIDKNTIVTDVGSAKEKVSGEIKTKIKRNISWISSHPIAGSEVSGPKFGNEKLFSGKWCVLIKDRNINKKHMEILSKFWVKIGCNIVYMNLKEHDHIFSITSHIPHLVAYNMVKTAMNFEKKKKSNIVKFSAGGLRDFTRTAASNEIMWKDIFLNNHKNITKGIDLFINNMHQIKKLINTKNEKQLIKIMQESKIIRKKIISSKQDVNLPDFGRR